MLRVTVELVPFGNEVKKETLGIINIVNDGNGDYHTGHYNIEMINSGIKRRGRFKTVEVKDFPRVRLGFWDLILRSLLATVGYRP